MLEPVMVLELEPALVVVLDQVLELELEPVLVLELKRILELASGLPRVKERLQVLLQEDIRLLL